MKTIEAPIAVTDQSLYHLRCINKTCAALLEVMRAELTWSADQRDGDFFTLKCPHCRTNTLRLVENRSLSGERRRDVSLDVYLYGEPEDQECRECGHVRPVKPCVFDANITHNLTAMARAVGIYDPIWHPEDIDIKHARSLIGPLSAGLALLKADPDHFRTHDSPNRWGTYDNFVPFVESYLAACREYPDAEVGVSR